MSNSLITFYFVDKSFLAEFIEMRGSFDTYLKYYFGVGNFK